MTTFLKSKWQNIIMVNYEIPSSHLLPYLPKGVELDLFHGKAYVSLVGFLFKDCRIFKIPIPLMGTFEEINLRFYVVRKVGHELRRGVVFINETVPSKLVAWVANKLYKEHYTSIPTKRDWSFTEERKELMYQWKVQSKWNSIKVNAISQADEMKDGSIEEFIFEHYYGYTKANAARSIEYKINHQRWKINAILDYHVQCDFGAFYGKDFDILSKTTPHSAMRAEGSEISVDWKRLRF